IGAQLPSGTGPIVTNNYGERELRPLPTAFTFIRAAFFMENTAEMLPIIKDHGTLPAFFDPQKKIPMVATRDIGRVAARALLEPPGQTQIINLAGPVDYSFNDAANEYSRVLGKAITATHVPAEGIAPLLVQAGISPNVAGLITEMSAAVESDLIVFEDGA